MLTYEFTEPLGKNYYEESYYIYKHYKEFIATPKKNTHLVLNELKIATALYAIIAIFCAFVFVFFSKQYNILFIVLMTIFELFFVYFLYLYSAYKKAIHKLLSDKDNKKVLTIDETKIEFADKCKTFSTHWDNIKYVLLEKHCICFLPHANTGILFFLPIEYSKEVTNFLISIGKAELIIDGHK